MRVGWVFSAIFDKYVVISRKRCILDTSDAFYRHSYYIGRNRTPYIGTLSIGNLAIQLTTPLLLRKLCKLFASVARFVSDSWAFLLQGVSIACYARPVLVIVGMSVRLSVRLSVTRWH